MKNKEYLKLMAEWMEMKRIKTNGQAQVCGRPAPYHCTRGNESFSACFVI